MNKNTIYSKFSIKESKLNGYEIIRRIDDTCYVNGALYNGNEPVSYTHLSFALRSSSAFFSFALASKAAVSNGSKNVGFSLS